MEETEELDEDIQMHLSLEKNESILEFWRNMIIVCQDKLEKLRADERRIAAGGVAAAVNQDIQRILEGKSYEQLNVLQKQVMSKLGSNQPIDVEYWENLLKELVVYKSKAKLSTMHQDMLARRLQQLRERQRNEAQKVQEELDAVLSMQRTDVKGEGIRAGEGIEVEPVDQQLMEQQDQRAFNNNQMDEEKENAIQSEEYDSSMSPKLVPTISKADKDIEIIDALEDMKDMVKLKQSIILIIQIAIISIIIVIWGI